MFVLVYALQTAFPFIIALDLPAILSHIVWWSWLFFSLHVTDEETVLQRNWWLFSMKQQVVVRLDIESKLSSHFVCYCLVSSVCSGLGARLGTGAKGNRTSLTTRTLNSRSAEYTNYVKLLDWGGFTDWFCPRGAEGPIMLPRVIGPLGVEDERGRWVGSWRTEGKERETQMSSGWEDTNSPVGLNPQFCAFWALLFTKRWNYYWNLFLFSCHSKLYNGTGNPWELEFLIDFRNTNSHEAKLYG